MGDSANSVPDAPGLLDVVPWEYGFVHSWAIAAMLRMQNVSRTLLKGLGLPWPAPLELVDGVTSEAKIGPVRADLTFTVGDAAGEKHAVALETKVDDPYRPGQVAAYAEHDHHAIVYMPGLTGLLWENVDLPLTRLSGRRLVGITEGLQLGPTLQSYVQAVRERAGRADRAAAAAASGSSGNEATAEREGPDKGLVDAAWLSLVYRGLLRADRDAGAGDEPEIRVVANDRGIFWRSSWHPVVDGSVFVDVLAAIRRRYWCIAIKAGDEGNGVASAWDACRTGTPSAPAGWTASSRRVQGGTATVWKLDVTGWRPEDAVAAARSAADWITTIDME